MPAMGETTGDTVVLEGLISILAALAARRRVVQHILLRQDARGHAIARIEVLAAAQRVPVRRVPEEVLARYARGHLHGGILALTGPRGYDDLAMLTAQSPLPFLVMLDGLEDPYNFGHTLRALYAAGVDGVVIRPRLWGGAEGTILRASAGAFDSLPLARAETPIAAADALRARGLLVACAAEDPRAVSIYEAPLAPPCLLVIGGERRGISRVLLDQADLLVRIPYGSRFRQSLGLTAAASILAFEVMRRGRLAQRTS